MLYRSTRNHTETAVSTRAVLEGIAPGGGLYMPQNLHVDSFRWQSLLDLSTAEMSHRILSHFLPEFRDMEGIVSRAYEGKFTCRELTPLVPVGDRYVLELFHGPTAAFKDVSTIIPILLAAFVL